MIFLTMPAMLVALIPIVIIEAFLISKRVPYSRWPVLRATAVANLVSTLVGIPLTWIVLFVCELFIGIAVFQVPAIQNGSSPMAQVVGTILTAPWLGPSEKTGSWAVPLAALVLLIPFFFVSVWSEYLVMERMLSVAASERPREEESSDSGLRRAVRNANLLSYGGLFALTCCWLLQGVFHK